MVSRKSDHIIVFDSLKRYNFIFLTRTIILIEKMSIIKGLNGGFFFLNEFA